MPSLSTPLASIRGFGPGMVAKFHELGIHTLQDGLWHFPFRHEDWRQVKMIADVTTGQLVTILGIVHSITARETWVHAGGRRRRLAMVEAVVGDESGATLSIVWFNQPYLTKTIQVNDRWYFSGKIRSRKEVLQMASPAFERPSDDPLHKKLVPVYSSVPGLSQRQIRRLVKMAVQLCHLVPESIGQETRDQANLIDIVQALQDIHFPPDADAATAAVRRLKVEELLAWQIAARAANDQYERRPALPVQFHEEKIRSFVQNLPFPLTNDQRLAAWEIIQAMEHPTPMCRLLQGDVGTGKTVVAAVASVNVVQNHLQAAWLAPTILLAEQHYQTLCATIPPAEAHIVLLTGHAIRSNRPDIPARRPDVLSAIADGRTNIVVGTHALLSPECRWHQLGFIVVDEQQRFGVEQRQALLARTGEQVAPHYLSLTATPIPRTLALFVSGTLAISRLRTRPNNRPPVTTSVLTASHRRDADETIRLTAARGEQVFVVTPLIEDSDMLGVQSATKEHARLHRVMTGLRVGLVHGAMPPEERLKALTAFRDREIDILVATTVLEVGVDVPGATLMVIESAERFGAAQLHQLRGRVGRGSQPGHCVFMVGSAQPSTMERLAFLATTTDGYEVAKYDLADRGSGDIYGVRQSGLPHWRLATLRDFDLMELASSIITTEYQRTGQWPESAWNAWLATNQRWHRE